MREEALEPGGAAGAEQQQARRHRIQRAAVADPRDAGRLADPLDDVVRGQALRLVEEEEIPAPQGIGRRHGSSSPEGGSTWFRSSSIRAPRSRERSVTKWSSGA